MARIDRHGLHEPHTKRRQGREKVSIGAVTPSRGIGDLGASAVRGKANTHGGAGQLGLGDGEEESKRQN